MASHPDNLVNIFVELAEQFVLPVKPVTSRVRQARVS